LIYAETVKALSPIGLKQVLVTASKLDYYEDLNLRFTV